MLKFSKFIWELELIDKDTDVVIDRIHFLTKRGVRRFLKQHENQIKKDNMKYIWGGRQLWL